MVLPVLRTVFAAVQTLSVQCSDLQTAAGQTKQGAGRPCHVSGSGNVALWETCDAMDVSSISCVIKTPSAPQIGHCYMQQLSTFPQELSKLLMSYHTVLEPDLRMVRISLIN